MITLIPSLDRSKLACVRELQAGVAAETEFLEYGVDGERGNARRGYCHSNWEVAAISIRRAVRGFDLDIDLRYRQPRYDRGIRRTWSRIAIHHHILYSSLVIPNRGAVGAIERPHGRVPGAGADLRSQQIVDVERVSELECSDKNREQDN